MTNEKSFHHSFNGKPKAAVSRVRAVAFGLPLNDQLSPKI